MPELHYVGPDSAGNVQVYSALSDAELTERIRAGAPRAYPAVQELKRRHLPAVLTYARLCGRNQVAGNQLAIQTFDLAAQEACRGIEPRGNWRHHLLMLVQRVGLTWADSGRGDRLQPDFVAWTDDLADFTPPGLPESRRLRFEESSAMLTGFYQLPELTRGVLWYALVDEEQDATVAGFLGAQANSVPELRDKARDAMRQAYVRAYLELCGDRKCLGFRRIIEVAAKPGDGRRSDDLVLHLVECPSCTRLVDELTRMADDPRAVFAEGLLGWGGAAYAARGPVRGLLDVVPAQPDRSKPTAGMTPFTDSAKLMQSDVMQRRGARRLSPPVVLVAVAVAVAAAVVAGTLLAAASEDSRPVRDHAQEPPFRPVWPPAAVPSPSPSPSPTPEPSKKPSRSPSPATSAPAPKRPAPTPLKSAPPRPVPIVPGGGFTQVVNAGTGLCLDIVNGVMENRTDVFTARCNGAPTQQWSLDSIGRLRSSADPDYCLDSRGATDHGVGIWACSYVNEWNAVNLLFTVDGSGVMHPQIAPDFAVEPQGSFEGSLLEFDPADGSSDQRWTAGASPKG